MKRLVLALLLSANLALAGPAFEVEGQGTSLDAAKKDAFRKAVEQAVGVVVVSDQELQNDKVTKDYIGNYSSGFVEDYEITDSWQEPDGLWTVRMNIRVATNKIAERMLSRAQKTDNINGSKIADSLDSQLEMLDNGDSLLGNVLSSYPQNAYVINSGETTFKISRLRQPYVDIPYTLSFSKFWVEAVNDAVKQLAMDSKTCNTFTMSVAQVYQDNPRYGNTTKDIARRVCGKDPDIRIFFKSAGDFFPKGYSYYLTDQIILDLINQQFQATSGQQHVGLRVDMLDAGGSIIDSRCTRVNNQLLIVYSDPVGAYNLRDRKRLSRPNIMGQNKISGTLRIQIENTQQLRDLAKVKLSVQQTCN